MQPNPLAPEALRATCDPEALAVETTDDLEPLEGFLNQDVALDAIRTSLTTDARGYNVIVLDATESGRRSVLRRFCQSVLSEARPDASPKDVCYVLNEDDPKRPRLILLPAGQGAAFKRDLAKTGQALPRLFAQHFRNETVQQFEQRILREADENINANAFVLAQRFREKYGGTPLSIRFDMKTGTIVVGIENSEDPSDVQDFKTWVAATDVTEERRRRTKVRKALLNDAEFDGAFEEFQRRVSEVLDMVRLQIGAFRGGAVPAITEPIFRDLENRYPDAAPFLRDLQVSAIKNAEMIAGIEAKRRQMGPDANPMPIPFSVNLIVDHSGTTGLPVVAEAIESFQDLFGVIESAHNGSQPGEDALNHMRISAGALLRANGGVLILDASRTLGFWEKLIATLERGELRFGGSRYIVGGAVVETTPAFEPDPVPLDCKIVLVCSRHLYHRLHHYPSFVEDMEHWFHIKAEFRGRMERTPENELAYAQFVAMCVEREGLLPFDAGAVGKIVEYGARLAGYQHQLSLALTDVKNVVLEAHNAAGREKADRVSADHVMLALEKKILRSAYVRDLMYERFQNGMMLFDPRGTRIGQINALAVYSTGDLAFGEPTRVTARHWANHRGMIFNVDREADLAGPISAKAVGILRAWLQDRYGQDKPLGRHISIAFEQTYGIEGDSATLAETIAALSALGDVPLRQDLAITGSMNQLGDAQVIGGENEKIEGFFDVCASTYGIDGKGIIIPAPNAQNLMLREDIVEACREGRFAVYPVTRIEEAVELFTGLPMDEVDRRIREKLFPPKRNTFWQKIRGKKS